MIKHSQTIEHEELSFIQLISLSHIVNKHAMNTEAHSWGQSPTKNEPNCLAELFSKAKIDSKTPLRPISAKNTVIL